MSARGDAAARLERALTAHAVRGGVTLAIRTLRSTLWASATFVGARHRVSLAISGDRAGAWLAGLAEADLPVHGHLVADLVVTDQRHEADGTIATIEVLTVEEVG